LGFLASVLVLVLVTDAAAVLVASMESSSLFLARRRWYRTRPRETAVQIEQEDAEAATVATQAWLDLAGTRASAVAGDHERLVHETVALAVALLESGRP
jgi:hypothetical protein